MNPIVHAAREMVVSDASCAVGYRRNNSLAGGVLAQQYQVPRRVAEAAVRAAVAGGLRFAGKRVSFAQMEYLQYVGAHPGCCVADVDRACRHDRNAGHYWVYASVRRLVRRGLLSSEPEPGGRVVLRLPAERMNNSPGLILAPV
jgi:hypothetical protein